MIKVFISSPYTNGDVAENVNRQIRAANDLMDRGFAPFTPLLYHFQHLIMPRPYVDWILLDLVWLEQCDCVLRLPSLIESPGADKECTRAAELGIPVFDSAKEISRYYTGHSDYD